MKVKTSLYSSFRFITHVKYILRFVMPVLRLNRRINRSSPPLSYPNAFIGYPQIFNAGSPPTKLLSTIGGTFPSLNSGHACPAFLDRVRKPSLSQLEPS